MKKHKLLAALTACACMLSLSPALPKWAREKAAVTIRAEAAAQVVYDLNTLAQFNRTKQEIAEEYSAARYSGSTHVNGDSSTYYSTPASTKSPYSQGVLTDDTVLCMETMTDFYRYLVGVPRLTSYLGGVEKLQYECLDRNFEFNHYISNDSKPDDMSDELWQKGYSCTHNILAWGYTPMGAITGWMNEGYSLSSKSFSTFGHRYALITPRYATISFGYCGTIAIGRDESSLSSRVMTNTAYAFPCPGYMPAELLSPTVSGWSLDLDTAKLTISDTSAITVTVTNLQSGESYDCTIANGMLQATTGGSIRFAQPADYNTTTRRYDSNYQVSVTGLTDKATGKTAEVRYEVDFFNVNDYAPSYVVSAGPRFDTIKMYSTLATEDTLKKLAAALPRTVTVTAETGRTVSVQTTGSWKLDMTNKCFTNSVSASQLPSDITDKNGVLKSLKIIYEPLDDYYGIYSTFSAYPSKLTEGGTLTFYVHPYLTNCSQSSIYRVTGSNGSYTATEVYNSSGPEYDKTNQKYVISDVRAGMSGDYLALMYAPESSWIKDAYLGRSPATVTISHSYKDTVTAPTCTAQGYTTHVCTVCGDTYKDTYTAKVAHTYTSKVTKAATCTADGVKTYTCSVCKASYTEPVTKLGHNYTTKVVAPTCTEQGYTLHTCTRCGASYKDAYTAKVAHTYTSKVTKAATCTADGVRTYTCSVCKTSYTEPITKLGHNYTTKVVAPTCTEQGYTLHTCTRCGDTYKDTYTAKTPHTYTSKVTKAATCTADGVRTYTCSVCKASYTEPITKLGHNYTTKVVAPTCTEQGYTLHTCTRCGASYKDTYTAKVAHTYTSKVTKAATCTADGVRTYTCSVCGDSYTTTIAKTAHKYVASKVAPTLEEEGYTLHTCSVCGDSYRDTPVPKLIDIAEADISLQYTAITYSSKGISADKYLTVTYGGRTLVQGEDFETSYKDNDKVGYQSCTLTISGIGLFGGAAERKLTVKPARLAAPTLTTKNSAIIVNWKKTTTDGLAYQVIYDKVPSFDTSAANHTEDYHTTTITDLNTLTKTLSAYTSPGETWYVRVRCFITSDGTVSGTRYGTFSKAVPITVKGNLSTASIPYSSYAYSGKAIKPAVTVKDTKGTKLTADDYTVSYTNNVKVGIATITLTGKGDYQGTITKTFIVKPANNSITSLTSTKANSFTVNFKKGTAGTVGYQILYCKNSSFATDDPTYHSTTVTDPATLTKTVSSNVKSGETWYVKVRSFYTKDGKTTSTRYGNYSAAKTVKIK